MARKTKKKTAKKVSRAAVPPPEPEEPELDDPFTEGDDPTPPVAHEPVAPEPEAETEPEGEDLRTPAATPKPTPEKIDADVEAAQRAAERSKSESVDDAWAWRDKAINVLAEKGYVREDVENIERYLDRGVTVYTIRGTGKPVVVSD